LIILLFGKNGQVGLALQRYLPKNIHLISKSKEEVDFTSADEIKKSIRSSNPNFIINAAAYTDVEKAELDSEKVFQINAYAPEQIALEAKKLKIPFIHLSTDYVFDGSGDMPWKPNDKVNPINEYGKSKSEGERRIVKIDCEYCILRTSWIFSQDNKNFLKTIINLSNKNSSISIIDDQIGGPTSSKSIAEACFKIIQAHSNNHFVQGVFHFSGYPYVSWAEFAEAIIYLTKAKATVKKIASSKFKTIAVRPKNSRLNCDSLFSTYNIKQSSWKTDLENVIEDLIKK
tara:strand:- start:2483 stop:3343 length:861 start_codon:yes stop_codon:yes gene_type:complete